MLERVYLRNHHSFSSGQIDLGILAEAALFYGETSLVLSRSSLWHLLAESDTDTILHLVEGGFVRPFFMTGVPAIETRDGGTSHERFAARTVGLSDVTMESEVTEAFRRRVNA